ncbi:MAG: respiratory nitrate reductase subunit gamma [Candidatus Thermoplasmatota archaeon]|nr:respiratory nitrate reductase subunit gamma [Candidatus Thermoplasmatota archaeon]
MSSSNGSAGRLSLYLILVFVISAFTLAVLMLPYDTVYVQDRAYLDWFLTVMIVCFAVFVLGTVSNTLVWMRGKGLVGTPESRLVRTVVRALSVIFSRKIVRLTSVFLREALYIAKLRELSMLRWFAHFMILGGFLLMFALDIFVTLSLDIFGWEAMISSDGWAKLLVRDFAFEIAGLMMLVGLAMALTRRYVVRPKQLSAEGADAASLVFLFLVVVGGFVLEGMGMAGSIAGHEGNEPYSFVGYAFSLVMPESVGDYYDQAWLVHAIMSALLIAFIPFSRLFHMLVTPVVIQLEMSLGQDGNAR